MAKRKAEVEDDEEQRAVFIDTSLDTHLVLFVSPTDTVSLLKRKILAEHPRCFPNLGEIKINALKVKRRKYYYHLLDSMLVRTAFYGVAKNWFLLADADAQIHLESGINGNEDDPFIVNKILDLEKTNKCVVPNIRNEYYLAEGTLNSEDLGDNSNKKIKKKRKRVEENDAEDENGGRLENFKHVRTQPPSTENIVRNVYDDKKSTNKIADDETSPPARKRNKHKVVEKDAQETSLLKANCIASDLDRVALESEAIISTSNRDDMQRNVSVDVNGLPSGRSSKDIKEKKKDKSSKLSSKINKTKFLMHTEDHTYNETEIDKTVLECGSRVKKTKKAKKDDIDEVDRSNTISANKIPEIPKSGAASNQNENSIYGLENSVIEKIELGTSVKKMKVKKGKVSSPEKIKLSSMQNNENIATCILSNGHVENENNYDLTDKANKGDRTHQTGDRRDLELKTAIISSQDGDEDVDNTRNVGEKTKGKIRRKQTVSIKGSTDVSLKEQSGEKTLETDIWKADDVDMLVNGDVDGSKKRREQDEDLHKDISKIPILTSSADCAQVRKTDEPHASKQKEKKHDLSSSVDTSYSGLSIVTTKKRRNERISRNNLKPKGDDLESECMSHIISGPMQPQSINKAEENTGIMSDRCKKRTEKKQSALEDPPKSPMKQQIDEKTRELAVSKLAVGDLLANTIVNDFNHQGELSLGEARNENFNDLPPSDSAALAEVMNQEKPHASKEEVKKIKESQRTHQNGTQLQESITKQQKDISISRPSEKNSGISKEGIEPQADPKYSLTDAGAKKSGNAGASMHDVNRLSGTSSMTLGSPVRKTSQSKKANELPKKQNENQAGSKRSSHKNMADDVNTFPKKKGLLATPGAIFEDGSSSSSDDENKVKGSESSTRTPSDNLSSSDYSEGESKGDVVTSKHDASKGEGQDATNLNSSGLKNLPLHSILRSSSRYKKAKAVASQLQDSEPPEFVPDSQANL